MRRVIGRRGATARLVAAAGLMRGIGGGGDGSPSSTTLKAMEGITKNVTAEKGKRSFEDVQAERRSVRNRAAAAAAAGRKQPEQGASSSDAAPSSATGYQPSAFVKKLNTMHTDMYDKRKEANFTLKEEKKKKARLAERRKLLRFREVDDELDALILRRDLFLWITTLRQGGSDSVIDQLLERELRFYPEESNREVRYNPKLFTGLPYLAATASSHAFPSLSKLTRLSSHPAVEQRLKAMQEEADREGRGGGKGAAASSSSPSERTRAVLSGSGDDRGGVTVNRSTFSKPTLVTLSQLTYNATVQQYDDLWVELLRPDTNPLRGSDTTGADGEEGPSSSSSGPISRPKSGAGVVPVSERNFNVLRLKTLETKASVWMQRILLSTYCRGLDPKVAEETLLGERLVRLFLPDFALRNFSATYCFLVDCNGRVRWMSSGEPTDAEREAFPKLLKELEYEYVRTR